MGFEKGNILWIKGKVHAEATKRKISEARKGKKRAPFSEKWRRHLSEANKGRIPWNKGKTGKACHNFGLHRSEEMKQKLREFRTGKTAEDICGIEKAKEMRKKMSEMKRGFKSPFWKGGRYINSKGYVFIYMPDHPFADCRKYVKRSRLVLEKHLGRYLEPKEIPHHKNGITNDDRIANLQLSSNQSEHAKIHKGNEQRFQSIPPEA